MLQHVHDSDGNDKVVSHDSNGRQPVSNYTLSDYRGVYPASYWSEFTGSAGTNDNDVVYTSGDISMYNTHYIEATAGTIDVDVSLDGTNWIAAVAGRSLVATASTTHVVEAASGVALEIKGKFKKLRINQKGATASNARGAHAWT